MIENSIYLKALQEISTYVNVEGKSFLITGASGLIGSCLVDLLMLCNKEREKKNHVYALGRNKKKLIDRFNQFVDNSYFHIVEQDICQPLDDNVFFDYIIHGASNADPISYAKYPAETMLTTLQGAMNVLEYGRKNKRSRIVMLSTFEVYGQTNKDVYDEQDVGIIDFNVLRASYPESKRSMEILSRCYVEEYDVQIIVVRLGSIYGPTMLASDSKAHAQFIRKALNHEDIVLKSKGEQIRTYCHVIDAVSGILTVLMKGENGHSYNVSNDQAVTTIANLAQTLADLAGVKVIFDIPSELEAKGFSKPQNIILDAHRLRSLGWVPLYSIQEGMKQTLNILKNK